MLVSKGDGVTVIHVEGKVVEALHRASDGCANREDLVETEGRQ